MTKEQALEILKSQPRTPAELARFKAALLVASSISAPAQTYDHDNNPETAEIPVPEAAPSFWSRFKFW
jgi:hypothetical protein